MAEMALAAIFISVVALLVAYLSFSEAKKSNKIASEALGLTEAHAEDLARAAEPNVEVLTSTARVVGRNKEGIEVLFQIHITNLSSQPEAVENLIVECDDLIFRWPPAVPTLRSRKGEPTTPFTLASGESRDYFYTFGPVPNVRPRIVFAEAVATCRRAGECRGPISVVVETNG